MGTHVRAPATPRALRPGRGRWSALPAAGPTRSSGPGAGRGPAVRTGRGPSGPARMRPARTAHARARGARREVRGAREDGASRLRRRERDPGAWRERELSDAGRPGLPRVGSWGLWAGGTAACRLACPRPLPSALSPADTGHRPAALSRPRSGASGAPALPAPGWGDPDGPGTRRREGSRHPREGGRVAVAGGDGFSAGGL